MRLASWQQMIGRLWRQMGPPPSRAGRRENFARLSLRRLEDRRVLNGTPVGMGVTVTEAQGAVVVDATQSEGASQTFNVSLEEKDGRIQLEITDNGTILYEEDIDNIASVTFRGGAESDVLIVDFSHGDPIPTGGITFVNVGPNQAGAGDSVQFVNGSASSVTYQMSSPTDGQVSIAVGSQTSTLQYSGTAETIDDRLLADSRSFIVDGSISQVQLADNPQEGMSQMSAAGGTVVDFVNPYSSLSVTTDPNATTTIDVHGLDSAFNAGLAVTAGSGSTVDFSAPTNLGTGSLSVVAGDIEVGSLVTTAGGTIELSATTQIVVAPTGGLSTTRNEIDLSAPLIMQQGIITAADGGTVRLDAGPTGTVLDSGVIDASSSSPGQTGGSVDLFGKYVGLTDHARIDVSGSAGGGLVRIGGDFHGENPDVQNAVQTYVGQDVVIAADAIDDGSGGRIVVWSEEATQFYGTIYARGGATAGDGGFVEVSSRQGLDAQGAYDLTAPNGKLGTLLFDPLIITITGAAAAGVPPVHFGDLPLIFSISTTTLANANADILLQAANRILVAGVGTSTLTLKPNVSITLQTRNDTAHLPVADSATGGITLVIGTNSLSIATQGTGSITMDAGVNADVNGVVSSHQGAANITVAGLTTQGGSITLDASGDVDLRGNVSSAGGVVTVIADSAGVGSAALLAISGIAAVTGTFTANAGVAVTTGIGALDITAAEFVLNATASLNSGTATIQGSDCQTVGLGLATGEMTIDNTELSHITSVSLTIGGAETGTITANGVVTNGQQGPVTLIAECATETSQVVFTGNASTFAALTAQGKDGIVVNVDVTTTGNGTDGHLALDGENGNIAFSGDRTLNAFGNLSLAATGGENFNGNLSLIAGGSVLVSNDLSGVGVLTGKTLLIDAANGITLNGNVTTAGAAFTADADTDANGTGTFTLADGKTVLTGDAALHITAADVNLGATGALNSGTATTTIEASDCETVGLGLVAEELTLDNTELSHITSGSLTIGGLKTATITADGVVTNGQQGPVTLIAECPDETSQVIFSGNASTFAALTAQGKDGIEVHVDVTTTGNGTDGHLALDGENGNIAFSGDRTLNAFGNLSLAATGGENFNGNLSLIAGGSVLVSNDLSGVGVLTGKTLLIDAVNGITLNGNVTTAGAAFTADADTDANGTGTFTLADGKTIQTADSALHITAADVQLGTGFLNSGTANTTIEASDCETVGLGSVLGSEITITEAQLQNITSGSLTIGGLKTATITADGVVTNGQQGPVTLIAECPDETSQVIFSGNASTFAALTAQGKDGIVVNVDVTTTGNGTDGHLALNGENGNIAFSGDRTLNAFGNLSLAATGGENFNGNLSLIAGGSVLVSNDLSGVGVLTGKTLLIDAANGITLNGNVTTAGATFTADADTDANGTGTFTLADGKTVLTGDAALHITAADVNLGTTGALNSGTANTTIEASDCETVGLGLVAEELTLDNTELSHITSRSLTIGGLKTATITADGVVTNGQQGPVTLIAECPDETSQVVFSGNASTFAALTAQGKDGIEVHVDVTTTGNGTDGHLTLDGETKKTVFGPGPVTLDSAGNVTVEAASGMEYSGPLTMIAVENVNLLDDLTATALLSPLAVTAGANITQENGTTIDAGSGTISFKTTSGDITLSHLVTTSPAAVPVLIQSGSAIINGLSPNFGANIIAPAMRLEAVNGIGSGKALETAVATLAAFNSTLGSIEVNNAGGPLVIGDVGGLKGIENDAPLGSIRIFNAGALTVNEAMLATQGGEIAMETAIGAANDLIISAHVWATGGDGFINLTAGHNLIVNAGGSGPDIQTVGPGEIHGEAQNIVKFAPGILIQTGVGAITQLSPELFNIVTPQLTAQGVATVSGSFSEPAGAFNYTVIIDWHDGTTSTAEFPDPPSANNFVLSHTFAANPNLVDQSAPIPITITVLDDPNSTFTGLNQPPVTTPLSDTATRTVGNGFNTIDTQITVPGEGLVFLNLAQVAVVISELHFSPPNALALSPVVIPVPGALTQIGDEEVAVFEEAAVEERQVFLQAIDPDGKVTDEVEMDEQVLDNLPGLFKQLPDGRYKILLKEPGETGRRLLLDVTLRGGKPDTSAETAPDAKARADDEEGMEGASRESERLPATGDAPRAALSLGEWESVAPVSSDDSRAPALVVVPAVIPPAPADRDEESGAAETEVASRELSLAGKVALAAAGALAFCAEEEWEERVTAVLAEAGPNSLSKAARLARRMRRPAVREQRTRWSRRIADRAAP